MRKHTKTVPSEKSKDTAIARKGENVRSGFRGRGISLLFAELCFEQADEGRNQRQHENPATGLAAPLLMLVTVRAMVPVAGMPPKK